MTTGATAAGRRRLGAATRIAPGRLEPRGTAHELDGGCREITGDQAGHALGGGADPGHQVAGLVLAGSGLVRVRAQPCHIDVYQRLAQLQPHHAGGAEGAGWVQQGHAILADRQPGQHRVAVPQRLAGRIGGNEVAAVAQPAGQPAGRIAALLLQHLLYGDHVRLQLGEQVRHLFAALLPLRIIAAGQFQRGHGQLPGLGLTAGGGRCLRPRLCLQRQQQHETAEQETGVGEGAHNDKFTLLSCRCRDFRHVVTLPATDWHRCHAALQRASQAPLPVTLRLSLCRIALQDEPRRSCPHRRPGKDAAPDPVHHRQ